MYTYAYTDNAYICVCIVCIFIFMLIDTRNVIYTLHLWCPLHEGYKCLLGVLLMVFACSYLHIILLSFILHIFFLLSTKLDCKYLFLSFAFFFFLFFIYGFLRYLNHAYICIKNILQYYHRSFIFNQKPQKKITCISRKLKYSFLMLLVLMLLVDRC